MSDEFFIIARGQVIGPLSTAAVRDILVKDPIDTKAQARKVGGESKPIYDWPEFADLGASAPAPVVPSATAPDSASDGGMFWLTKNCAGCIIALVVAAVVGFVGCAIAGGMIGR